MNLLGAFGTYKGLPKSVYVIFFAQIINRFGDFVRPFLTLFLTSQFNYSVSYTGIIVMVTILATIPGSILGGKIADHTGRKKSYIAFQLMSGIALLACTFLYTHPVMILLIILSSFFGGGVRPIIGAILADVLSPEDRQRGFSLSYLGINIGVALGPIVAGFLFNHMLFMVFLGDALTSFIAVGLVLAFIDESLPSKEDDSEVPEQEQHVEGTVLSVLLKRPALVLFLVFNAFYSASYVQSGFSLPLVLSAIYGDQGAPIFGSIMSLNAVTVIFTTLLLTRLCASIRPIYNIAISGVLYAVGFGMIGFIHSMPLFWVSTILWTFGEIVNAINFGVYITNHTPRNFRARFNAVTSLSFSIGSILGTAAIGKYIDMTDIFSVWWLVGALSAVGAVGIFAIGLNEHKTS